MHKVETWNRASAAEVDGIACCIFSESAHTTSAREHTTRNVGVRPRMWTACIAHVFDMLTFVSHLPSSIIYPGAESPQNIEVRVFPKYNWVVYSTTRAMRRAGGGLFGFLLLLFLACAPPLITFFVGWPEPRLLRVASLCVVVALAAFYIYLFIYLQPTTHSSMPQFS